MRKIGITEPTGYGWLDSWNKGGYVGLAPNFSGGPKPKLGEAEREELKRLLGEKDAWTLKEVRILIKEKFNVEYSEMQVWRILTSWKRTERLSLGGGILVFKVPERLLY